MTDLRNNGPQSAQDAAGPDAVRDAFRRQARICPTLGSPFMGILMAGLAEGLAPGAPVPDAILGWRGRPWADALALRVAGGLHALARSGARPALTAAYPGGTGGDLIAQALAALNEDHAYLLPWLSSAPQTNEVGRSSVLLGGALYAAARLSMPLEVLEIGSSAGLNLMFDRWRHDLGDGRIWGPLGAPATVIGNWQGATPPLSAPLLIAARAGCDLRPVDASDAAARARMLAYIWPDQSDRLTRAGAALSAVAAAGVIPEAADAGAWLGARMARNQARGTARMLIHTITWQYLPEGTRTAIRGTMAGAALRATDAAPLVWLRMEPDGAEEDASIRLTIWPGGEGRELGRGDFHGRWARWHDTPKPIPAGGPGI
ncbi:MAG: hypothetical protein ACJAVR_001065 [Paracoccaceae bacterium]|jgi:hypothetical protein